MTSDNGKRLPETESGGLNLEATELTLGLRGKSRVTPDGGAKPSLAANVGFWKPLILAWVTTKALISWVSPRLMPEKLLNLLVQTSKAQAVGWPPVRGYAKRGKKSCKYVKVAVDGAPYLRKVDLEMYNTYQQLLTSLEDMFSCFTIRNFLNEKKMDRVNGIEYVPTYEDKDGDWMLVGDVPWQMFVEFCKRIRLMKSTEAVGLAPRTAPKCSRTSAL